MPKGSKLVLTFLSVLAAQRDGDHDLKLLMTSDVLYSDSGMFPMLTFRPAVHLLVTFIRNYCLLHAEYSFFVFNVTLFYLMRALFQLDQCFNTVQFDL